MRAFDIPPLPAPLSSARHVAAPPDAAWDHLSAADTRAWQRTATERGEVGDTRSGDATAALLEALDAARGVRHAGDGLVVVLLRGSGVAASLHWPIEGTITTIVGGVAVSPGTDRAVLIVVGSLKVAGTIIRTSDVAEERLTTAGVAIAARVHVSALAEGLQCARTIGAVGAPRSEARAAHVPRFTRRQIPSRAPLRRAGTLVMQLPHGLGAVCPHTRC